MKSLLEIRHPQRKGPAFQLRILHVKWQALPDSNRRHLVLETSALPAELRAYAARQGENSVPQPGAPPLFCLAVKLMGTAARTVLLQFQALRRFSSVLAGRIVSRLALGASHSHNDSDICCQ